MSQSLQQQSSGSTRNTCLVIIVVLAFVVFLISRIVGGAMISSNKAGCEFIQSAISQLSPAERAVQPQTAEQCRAMIDAASGLVYIQVCFMTGIFTIVILGMLFGAYTIFGRGKQTPPSAPTTIES